MAVNIRFLIQSDLDISRGRIVDTRPPRLALTKGVTASGNSSNTYFHFTIKQSL